jgi:hydrogenase nickel incorporation protein HypA/HybF
VHELFATQAILDTALKTAAERQTSHIIQLHLALGEMSGYVEDSVQFYWDEISKGTIAEGATLNFRHVPPECQCMACFTKYAPLNEEIRCPACGSAGAKVLAGEEFFLEAIDVE